MDLRQDFFFGDIYFNNFINLDDEDLEIIRSWRNNENIRKWMYNDEMIEKEEHANFIDSLRHKSKTGYWLVKRNKQYTGVLDITKIDFKNKNAYFGIYGNPEERIEGRGKILAKAMKELAFDKLKLHSIHLEAIEDNERAINFYEKIGFTKEGTLREFVFKDNKWKNVIVLGMTEDDYKNR